MSFDYEQIPMPNAVGPVMPRKPIRDPVVAVAVAKCYLQRSFPRAHPEPCRYCKIPDERKLGAVIEFNTWVEQSKPDIVAAFEELPQEEQKRLVDEHMGYGGE